MSQELLSAEEKLESIERIVEQRPEIVGLQSYEYFRNNEHEQRNDFVSGRSPSLLLEYPDLKAGKIQELALVTRGVLLALGNGDESPKTKSLYDAIEYRYSEMVLIDLAAQTTNPDSTQEERQEALAWFKATNEALYGVPDTGTFNSLAEKKMFAYLEKEYPRESTESELQAELRNLVGELSPDRVELYKPDVQTLERINGLVRERFEAIVEHIDPDKVYTVPEIKEAFDIALEKLGGKELGWEAVIAQNSSALATSPHRRLLEVGENRKELKGVDLRAKVIHEAGIHALRSINAEQAGWLSAAYGQEGYLPFEEAAATALEDASKGKFIDHGEDYYLIAGLAYGLDMHKPRDLREVFEIMWRVNALVTYEKTEVLDDEAITKAKSKALTNCIRMFRGTTTHDKGIIYSKDLAYFNGQELAWSVLDKTQTQEDLELIVAGKLDLTRDEHIAIAQQIVETNHQLES